jgi:hypothetical protein
MSGCCNSTLPNPVPQYTINDFYSRSTPTRGGHALKSAYRENGRPGWAHMHGIRTLETNRAKLGTIYMKELHKLVFIVRL